MLETAETNPDNKYDDGSRERVWAVASEDEMLINLIGRGVFCGYKTVTEGTVQTRNRHMIGEIDYIIMLDGGGHAWGHEIDDLNWESKTGANFERWVNGRRINKVAPQHDVAFSL